MATLGKHQREVDAMTGGFSAADDPWNGRVIPKEWAFKGYFKQYKECPQATIRGRPARPLKAPYREGEFFESAADLLAWISDMAAEVRNRSWAYSLTIYPRVGRAAKKVVRHDQPGPALKAFAQRVVL